MRVSKKRPLLLAVFFLSGTSSLVYEVVWERQLSLAFGVSVYATSAVLTAFMGGLALGSWLSGRLVSRYATAGKLSPAAGLRLYAAVVAATAGCALLTILLFPRLPALYTWIYRVAQPGFFTLNVIRFGLSVLLLLIPTILMGATLPALSHVLAQRETSRGRDVGALYAVNTFGGVLGAALAGLALIRLVGARGTLFVAVVLDIAAAGAALALSRHTGPLVASPALSRKSPPSRSSAKVRPATSAVPELSRGQRRLILWGVLVSGFAALSYEVVWTRILAISSVSAVFSFTVMLATFLAGLAVGSSLSARWADRWQQPVKVFGFLQLGIGLSAILVLFVFAKLPSFLEGFIIADTFGKLVIVELTTAFITMFVPTVLMGAVFPLAVRLLADQPDGVGREVGRLYAMNSLGSTLGPWVAGFALIPLLGLQRTSLAAAALNIGLGVAAGLMLERQPRLVMVGALAGAIGLVVLLPPGVYLGFREGTSPYLVYYREGIDATVAVFEVPNPPLKISFVNGRNEVPTDSHSMRAFHLLGHLPSLLNPEADSALVVSFGNGITAGALASHNIARIQAVELVAEQIEAARLYEAENRGVLGYTGLEISIEDGRNYLLRTDETFDIITADATHPINTSSWALFSQEFYMLARAHLAEDGVMIQWLPFHDLAERDYRAIIRTFQSVFPHTTLWYTGGTHSFLVSTAWPITAAEMSALAAQVEAQGLTSDLGSPVDFTGYLLMDEMAVATYADGARLITDDTAFFTPARDVEAILESYTRYASPALP